MTPNRLTVEPHHGCLHKVRFDREQDAHAFGLADRSGGKGLRVYLCSCSGWHLTKSAPKHRRNGVAGSRSSRSYPVSRERMLRRDGPSALAQITRPALQVPTRLVTVRDKLVAAGLA